MCVAEDRTLKLSALRGSQWFAGRVLADRVTLQSEPESSFHQSNLWGPIRTVRCGVQRAGAEAARTGSRTTNTPVQSASRDDPRLREKEQTLRPADNCIRH